MDTAVTVLVFSSVLSRILQCVDLLQGDVANEVETEQMVHDSGVSSLSSGHFTSFVQLRGSVPSQWSQDISKMVPKPAISFDLSDPFCETAGKVIYSLCSVISTCIMKAHAEEAVCALVCCALKPSNWKLDTHSYEHCLFFCLCLENRFVSLIVNGKNFLYQHI